MLVEDIKGGVWKDCYRLDIYNVYANRWDPSPIITPHCWFAMTVLDDKLIIAGGETRSDEPTNKILVLDEGKWKDYSEMPTAREAAVAVGYQSMLIVVGGQALIKGSWTLLAITELLDTTNRCWYTCGNFPVSHQQLKAAIVNSTLYLLGGANTTDDGSSKPSLQMCTASLDNLSSHQLKWQSLPDISWCYSTPVVLCNLLLTVGGRRSYDRSSQTSNVCTFNPLTGMWKQVTNIPSVRSSPAVVIVADNKMLIVGGLTD